MDNKSADAIPMSTQPTERHAQAVVEVAGGRGFVIQGKYRRYILTAAHCLPHLPPACAGAGLEERTYQNLLGSLHTADRNIWAECLFVELVGDLAILGPPDGQELYDQAEAYEELVDASTPISIRSMRENEKGWMLPLGGDVWFSCQLQMVGPNVWITEAAEPILAGMSGSPILGDDGKALSLVNLASGDNLQDCRRGGPSPKLTETLPPWWLSELGVWSRTNVG